MDDLMQQFAQIQKYAAAVHALISEAQDRAPQQSEGSDHSKTVHVVLGHDGLPKSFRVRSDWNRRVEASAFGDAVVEACQAAIGTRLATWSAALQNDGWNTRADRLRSGLQGSAAAPERSEVPFVFRKPMPEAPRPRPLGDIVEDVLRAFDNFGEGAPEIPAPILGSGSASGGKIAITLSSTGLTSCKADPYWTSQQTAAQLMTAISVALSAAKRDLAMKTADAQPDDGLDRLFGEAMTLLNDPFRLVE